MPSYRSACDKKFHARYPRTNSPVLDREKRRSASNRAGPSTGIDADQNESRNMAERLSIRKNRLAPVQPDMNYLLLATAPASPDQSGDLTALEPSLAPIVTY